MGTWIIAFSDTNAHQRRFRIEASLDNSKLRWVRGAFFSGPWSISSLLTSSRPTRSRSRRSRSSLHVVAGTRRPNQRWTPNWNKHSFFQRASDSAHLTDWATKVSTSMDQHFICRKATCRAVVDNRHWIRKILVDVFVKDLHGKFYCPECLTQYHLLALDLVPTATGAQLLETTQASRSTGVPTQAHVLYLMEWEKSAEDRGVSGWRSSTSRRPLWTTTTSTCFSWKLSRMRRARINFGARGPPRTSPRSFTGTPRPTLRIGWISCPGWFTRTLLRRQPEHTAAVRRHHGQLPHGPALGAGSGPHQDDPQAPSFGNGDLDGSHGLLYLVP